MQPEPCKVCNDLGKFTPAAAFFKSCTLKTLKGEEGSDQSCPYCLIIFHAAHSIELPANLSIGKVAFWRSQRGIFGLRLYLTPGDVVKNYTFYSSEGSVWPYTVFKSMRPISNDTSSKEALAWVIKKFDFCVGYHTCSVRFSSEMPGRLVDVGTGRSPTAGIKLCTGPMTTQPYICLSHCWGKETPLTLTSSNEAELTERVSWQALPPTFRDAITVTRELGVRYIWIDSLCIRQDDRSDWHSESKKMRAVYQNAVLTIAATASNDSYSGLFRAHDSEHRAIKVSYIHNPSTSKAHSNQVGSKSQMDVPNQKPRIGFRSHMKAVFGRRPTTSDDSIPSDNLNDTDGQKLPTDLTLVQNEACYVREEISHAGFDGYMPKARLHTDHPLLTRAWVYQERLLSGRVLHFGRDELIWECFYDSDCECSELAKLGGPSYYFKTGHNSALQSEAGAHRRWRAAVSEYSNLDLSFKTDRLPAIAGIAQQLQEFIPSKYVAGLWEGSIIKDLGWSVLEPLPESTKCGGPSWSWASQLGAISYMESRESEVACCEILEVSCTNAGADKYGEAQSGRIVISAPILKVKLARIWDRSLKWYYTINNADFHTGVYVDNQVPDEGWQPIGAYDYRKDASEEYICIPLSKTSYSVEFLLLRRLKNDEEVYERIGSHFVGEEKMGNFLARAKEKRTITIV